MEESVEDLRRMVAERDNTLMQLKARTKAYVDSMKAEKRELEESLQSRSQEVQKLQKLLQDNEKKLLEAGESQDGTPEQPQGGDNVAEVLELRNLVTSLRAEVQKEKVMKARLGDELTTAKQENVRLMTKIPDKDKEIEALKKQLADTITERETHRRKSSLQNEEFQIMKLQSMNLISEMDEQKKVLEAELKKARDTRDEALKMTETLKQEATQRDNLVADLKKTLGRVQDEADKKMATLESQLAVVAPLRKEIDSLKQALAKEKQSVTSLEQQTRSLDESSSSLTDARRKAEEQSQKALLELEESKRREAALQGELHEIQLKCQRFEEQAKAISAEKPSVDDVGSMKPEASGPEEGEKDLIDFGFGNEAASTSSVDLEVAQLRHQVQVLEAEGKTLALELERERKDPQLLERNAKEQEALSQQVVELTRQLEEARASQSQTEGTSEALKVQVQAEDEEKAAGREAEITDLKNSLSLVRQSLAEKDGIINQFKCQLEAQEANARALDEELLSLRAISGEKDAEAKALEGHLARYELDIVALREKLEALESRLGNTLKEKKVIEEKLVKVEGDKTTLTTALQMTKVDQSKLADALDSKVKSVSELEKSLQEKTDSLTSLQGAFDQLKREKAQVTGQLEELQGEVDDTIRRIKSDAETELAGARFQLNEAQQAKAMMEKSVGSLNAQVEALRRNHATLTREHEVAMAEWTKKLKELQAELAGEKDNGVERRRQMKVYLEGVAKEKVSMEEEIAELKGALEKFKKARQEAIERADAAEAAVQNTTLTWKKEIQELQQANQEMEEQLTLQIAMKQREIDDLRDEQAQKLNSTTKKSEEMITYLQAAEAEKAEHKAKRLAAKNEMITLAQTLEEMNNQIRTIETTLQHTLVPRALEQIGVLESAICQLDDAIRFMSPTNDKSTLRGLELRNLTRFRSRTGRLISIGSSGASRERSSSSDQLLLSAQSSAEDHGIIGEEETKVQELPSVRLKEGRAKNVIADRMEQLNNEMDRVSAGLNMLTQNLERLQDSLHATKQNICSKALGELMACLRGRESNQTCYSSVNTEEIPPSPDRLGHHSIV